MAKPQKGDFKRIVDQKDPVRPRFHRVSPNVDHISLLTIDLIEELSKLGVAINHVKTVATGLVSRGWIKIKQPDTK